MKDYEEFKKMETSEQAKDIREELKSMSSNKAALMLTTSILSSLTKKAVPFAADIMAAIVATEELGIGNAEEIVAKAASFVVNSSVEALQRSEAFNGDMDIEKSTEAIEKWGNDMEKTLDDYVKDVTIKWDK